MTSPVEDSGGISWLRVIIAIVLGEALPLVALYLLIALYGVVATSPSLPSADTFAQNAGLWIGPIVGSLVAYIVSYLAGADTPRYAVPQALLIGVLIAAIDFGILVAIGAEMRPLYFASNAAKVLAAMWGGISASRGRLT